MKPGPPAPATVASLADRLATLAELWPNVATKSTAAESKLGARYPPRWSEWTRRRGRSRGSRRTRPGVAPDRSPERGLGMPGIRAGPAGGRRPGRVLPRGDAATRRVPAGRTGSGDDGVVEEILRRSDGRWGNYLSPLDPRKPARRSPMSRTRSRNPRSNRTILRPHCTGPARSPDGSRACGKSAPGARAPCRAAASPRDREGASRVFDRSTDPERLSPPGNRDRDRDSPFARADRPRR